jgi:hypothetical protein
LAATSGTGAIRDYFISGRGVRLFIFRPSKNRSATLRSLLLAITEGLTLHPLDSKLDLPKRKRQRKSPPRFFPLPPFSRGAALKMSRQIADPSKKTKWGYPWLGDEGYRAYLATLRESNAFKAYESKYLAGLSEEGYRLELAAWYGDPAGFATYIESSIAPGADTKRQIARWTTKGMIRRLRRTAPLSERERTWIVDFLARNSSDRGFFECHRDPVVLREFLEVELADLHDKERIASYAGPPVEANRPPRADKPITVETISDRELIRQAKVDEARGPPPRPETRTAPCLQQGAGQILSPLRKGDLPENTQNLHSAQQRRRWEHSA